MKITSIEITRHRLPLEPSFTASWDPLPRTKFDAVIVRVHTDQGITGIGSGDHMLGFEAYERLFVGQDPRQIERHWRVLDSIQFHGSRCWALDIALWDLYGKAVGEPVWRLLGGRSNAIRAYASTGALRDPIEAADMAEEMVGRGFEAMKLRFHRPDWWDDIYVLEAVRDRIGDQLAIMVDCNQGWRMPWDLSEPWTLKDAEAVARELKPLNVYWMEEPLSRSDRAGMAALRQKSEIRIAGGEMAREMHDLRDLMTDGCLDVIQPDCVLTGGITGLRRIAQMAEAQNITFSPHTWSNGIGVLANAHLTMGVSDAPYLEFPFDPPDWSLERRDFVLAEPFAADSEGWLTLSEEPGLGIVLDEKRLKKTLVD